MEDVLGGLDGLGADLAGELHRELGALDGHDDRGRIVAWPVARACASARGVVLGAGSD